MRTALMLAAFAERCLGRFDEAIALLARARDVARPSEVALALADIHILMGEFSTAARYAEQAQTAPPLRMVRVLGPTLAPSPWRAT